jgi:uncharacterized membrane protein YhaH (DUF805 family)
MTFTQAVSSVLSNYVTFAGRARRAEYWWFYLFTLLVGLATAVIDAVLNTAFNNEIGIVGTLTSLGLLLPTMAVTARRLHDTGRTGWWMLLPVVPLFATILVAAATAFVTLFSTDTDGGLAIGMSVLLVACVLATLAAAVTLLVFLCLDSNPGPNKFGPSPKQPTMPPSGPAGYPFAGYNPHRPVSGHGPPYGYPQPPLAPPAPGSYPPQS